MIPPKTARTPASTPRNRFLGSAPLLVTAAGPLDDAELPLDAAEEAAVEVVVLFAALEEPDEEVTTSVEVEDATEDVDVLDTAALEDYSRS
jgi:hypothetical protein